MYKNTTDMGDPISCWNPPGIRKWGFTLTLAIILLVCDVEHTCGEQSESSRGTQGELRRFSRETVAKGLARLERGDELSFKPTVHLIYDDVKDNDVFLNINGHIAEEVVVGGCYIVPEIARPEACTDAKCGLCFPRVLANSSTFVVDYPLTSAHSIVFEKDCNYYDNKNRQFCIAPYNALGLVKTPKYVSRDMQFSTLMNLEWFEVPKVPGTCAIVAKPFYIVCFPRNIMRSDILRPISDDSHFSMYYSGFSKGQFANLKHQTFVQQHYLKLDLTLYDSEGVIVTDALIGTCGKYFLDRNGTLAVCISHPDFPEYDWSVPSEDVKPTLNTTIVTQTSANLTVVNSASINDWLGVKRKQAPVRKLISLYTNQLVGEPIEGFCYSYNYSKCEGPCGLCVPHIVRDGSGNITELRLYHEGLSMLTFDDKEKHIVEGTCGYFDSKLNITFCVDFAYDEVRETPKTISKNMSRILESVQFNDAWDISIGKRGGCAKAPSPLGYTCMPLKVPHIVTTQSKSRTGYGFADYWIDSEWKDRNRFLTLDVVIYDALNKVVDNPQVGRCDYFIYKGAQKERACILYPEYEDDVFEVGANGNLVGIVNSGESSTDINSYPDLSDINVEIHIPQENGSVESYNTSSLNSKLKKFGYASCAWEGLSEEECSKGCDPSCIALYQDGVCQSDCNSFNCAYDGGDCDSKLVPASSIFQTLLLAELDMDYPSFQKISTQYLIFLGSVLDSVILVNKTYSTAQIGESPTAGRTKIMFNYWRAKRSVLTSPALVVEYLNSYVRNESMPYMRAISEQPVDPNDDDTSGSSDEGDDFAKSGWFIAIMCVAFVGLTVGTVVYKRRRNFGSFSGKKFAETPNSGPPVDFDFEQPVEEEIVELGPKKEKMMRMSEIQGDAINAVPTVPVNPLPVSSNISKSPGINPLHTILLTSDMNAFKHYISLYSTQGKNVLFSYVNDNSVPGKFTPLMIACRMGNTEAVSMLLSCGCDVNMRNVDGETALAIACREPTAKHAGIVHVMLQFGADPRIGNDNNVTPLHTACAYGDVAIVEQLCSRDSDLNRRDNDGTTPLTNAVKYGNSTVVSFLLSVIIILDVADNKKWTALHWACANGNVEIVRLLLSKTNKVNLRNDKDETPLLLAAREGHTPIISLLLSRNADKKIGDKFSRLPADIAKLRGHKSAVELLENGSMNLSSSSSIENSQTEVQMSRLIHSSSPESADQLGVVPGDSDVGGFLNSFGNMKMNERSFQMSTVNSNNPSNENLRSERSTCSPLSIALDENSTVNMPEYHITSPNDVSHSCHSSSPTASNNSVTSPGADSPSNTLTTIIEEHMKSPTSNMDCSGLYNSSSPTVSDYSHTSPENASNLTAIIEERVNSSSLTNLCEQPFQVSCGDNTFVSRSMNDICAETNSNYFVDLANFSPGGGIDITNAAGETDVNNVNLFPQ